MTETKRALVTGITGQDGSYLAELLLEKGYEVIGLARRSTNYYYGNISHLASKIILEYGDLLDGSNLGRIVSKYEPQEVYNLASQSVPADSWAQPIVTAEITAVGTLRLLDAVHRNHPTAKFFQATSREIYGRISDEVVDEKTPYRANNPYGVAKLYAHLTADIYRESFNLFTCGGILFNHESPRRSLHFVTRKVTMAVACISQGVKDPPLDELGQPLVQGGKVRLGNLDTVKDWGYAKEYVEAMWLMLQNPEPQNYVIATNRVHTVSDLCAIAFGHVGLNWEDHVEVDERLKRPANLAASRGDYSKARTELGWEPRTSFKELIQMMVDADMALVSKQNS